MNAESFKVKTKPDYVYWSTHIWYIQGGQRNCLHNPKRWPGKICLKASSTLVRIQRKTPVSSLMHPSLSPLLKFLGKMGFIVPQHTVRTCPVHVHCTRYGKTERDKSLERCWGQPLTPSIAPQPQPWPCISGSSRCFWCGWVWAGIGSPALWVRTWDMYGLSVPLWHHVPCSLMELPGRVVFNLFPSSFP